MNVILTNYGKGHYTYTETNAFIKEIFKNCQDMDKKPMVDAFLKIQSKKKIIINPKSFVQLKQDLKKELKLKPCMENFEIKWTGGMMYTFDEKLIDSSKMTISNGNKTVKRKGGSAYYCVFGSKVIKRGVTKWQITVDEYPGKDYSGFVFGAVEED